MQAVLRLGICLLILAAFLRATADVVPEGRTSTAGPDGGLSIIAAAKGPLLPMPPLPGGSEVLGDVIMIGDRIIKFDSGRDGLRVAALAPGLAFDSQHAFDLARSERHVNTFLDLTSEQAIGSLLVMITYTNTAPEPGHTDHFADDLSERFAELGAEADPLDPEVVSWAMITVRRPKGWVKLAEAWSPDQGVSLVFTVAPELARYDGHRGDLLSSYLEGEARMLLSQELGSARTTGRAVRERWGSLVGDKLRESIACTPSDATDGPEPVSVRWEGVALGAGATFRSGIGLRDGSWDTSDGATFSLLVNGTEVHAETLSSDPGRWREWEVGLDAWSDERVDLELRVSPLGTGSEGVALWGAPTLVYRGKRAGGSTASGPTEALRSPYNGRELETRNHLRSYSFVVSGSLLDTGFGEAAPARMNAIGAEFAVGVGSPPAADDAGESLATRLETPVFHPAGNRAMESTKLHVEGDGSGTIVSMIHGRTLYLFVELAPSADRLCPEQLSFLRLALAGAGATEGIASVAVFSQKLLWAPDNARLKGLLEHADPAQVYATDGSFERDILPTLERLAAVKPVAWFAGDLQGTGSIPLVLHRPETGDLAFLAVGKEKAGNDAFVRVDVDAEGHFRYRAVGPGDAGARALDAFDVERWVSAAGPR